MDPTDNAAFALHTWDKRNIPELSEQEVLGRERLVSEHMTKMLGVADRDVEDNLIFEEPSHDDEAAMWDFQKTEESMQNPPAIGFVPRASESNPRSTKTAEKKLMTALVDLHNEGIRHHQYSSSEVCLNATPDYLVKFIRQPGHADPVPFRFMPHQREGVGFALRLYKKGYGGCCWADDPGLGKTLQTSGLMMEADKDCRSASLIPKYSDNYGDGRKGKWEENLKDFDLIVTTYNIVKSEQRDYEAHRRQKWQHMRPEAEFDREAEQLAAGNVQMRPGHDTAPLLAFPRGPYEGQRPLANIQFHILRLDEVHKLGNQDTRVGGGRLNSSYEDMNTVCDLLKLSPLNNSRLFNKYIREDIVKEKCPTKTMTGEWSHKDARIAILGAILNGRTIQRKKIEKFDDEPMLQIGDFTCDDMQLTWKIHNHFRNGTSNPKRQILSHGSNASKILRIDGTSLEEDHLGRRINRACLGASHYAAPYATGTIFKAEAEAREDGDQYVEDAPVQGRAKQDYDWMLEQMRADGSRYQSNKLRAAVEVVTFSLQREQHRIEGLYLSYGTYRE
ncbi:hypothetical protein LTR67_005703 [Exophiala xenobiotica]